MPVCLVNVDGYYDGLIMQMKRAQSDGLLPAWVDDINKVVKICNDGIEALEHVVKFLSDADKRMVAARQTTSKL